MDDVEAVVDSKIKDTERAELQNDWSLLRSGHTLQEQQPADVHLEYLQRDHEPNVHRHRLEGSLKDNNTEEWSEKAHRTKWVWGSIGESTRPELSGKGIKTEVAGVHMKLHVEGYLDWKARLFWIKTHGWIEKSFVCIA